MTVEDNDKFLPTSANGLALHMGDINTPHPVVFMGGGGGGSVRDTAYNRRDAHSSSSRSRNHGTASSATAGAVGERGGGAASRRRGPSRDGRSLSAFVTALEDARSQVQGSRTQVGCVV